MSALFDAVGFYLDHGAMVAGAAVLVVGAIAFTVSALLRSNRPKSRDDIVVPTGEILLPATTAASSDPQALLRALSRTRKSHVVVLPWMGETNFKDEDAPLPANDTVLPFEAFLHNFRNIPADQPIDLLLLHDRIVPLPHARRFAKLLMSHKAPVTAIIPYRAFGGSCLLALAADEIIMSKDAALVFDPFDSRHYLAAARLKGLRRMSDMALMRYHFVVQHIRETNWLAGILLHVRQTSTRGA